MSTARITLLAAALLAFAAPSVLAQELFGSPETTVPPQVEAMYVKGIAYLQRTQKDQGCWGDGYGQQPGVVGLATLAMLAHGDDPNYGPQRVTISRALDFILKNQDQSTSYIGSSMYNHGFATLCLAESYGQVHDPRLGPALEKAVRLLLAAQSRNRYGAWRYHPESTDADTTVSGACLVALFAARNAGIGVPKESFDKALDFYRLCQSPEGGFGYTNASGASPPRGAIGALILALAKQKRTKEYARAIDYLRLIGYNQSPSYWNYYLYYAAQAEFHGPTEDWERWNQQNIRTLTALQAEDGSWPSSNGSTYGTAMVLLSLALNYRFLPIYER